MQEILRGDLQSGSVESFLSPSDVQRNAVGVAVKHARNVLQILTEQDIGREKQLEIFEDRVQGIDDLEELNRVISTHFSDGFLGAVQSRVRARCEVGVKCKSPVRQALLKWTSGVEVPVYYREFVSRKIGSKNSQASLEV